MRPGDIIITPIDNLLYHAGIYAGRNHIIHYCEGKVKYEKIDITKYKVVQLVHNPRHTLYQARIRIGEQSIYNIFTNNCWHFVFTCAFDDKNALDWMECVRQKYNVIMSNK